MSYKINPNREQAWNSLPELPIERELYRTLDVLEQLGNAKAALARLQGRSVVIPNQGMLINSISLQEAKSSSEIENIFTTDDELYQAFSNNHLEPKGAAKEVIRYREALWRGHSYLQSKNEFDLPYFVSLFQEIKQTTDSIRLPFNNTIIKQSGTGPNAGKTIYTPPRGTGIIESKLDNLISYLNNDEKYIDDPLIKMAISHFQFEAIHPFRDGNGRVGRIFNINYLTHKKLLDYPILYLSGYILQKKDDYYHFLQGVSQRGDWESWIIFMLKAIENTSNKTYSTINEIIWAKDELTNYLINEKVKIKNVEKLVEYLFFQPYIKVKHLVNGGLYSENTARDYLNKLSEMQILEKIEIEGNHYYRNNELYKILV